MSIEKKQQLTEKQLTILESEMQKRRKNLVLSYVLLIFLGALGVHKFYLGKTNQGVEYLVLTVAIWVLGAGSIILGGLGSVIAGEAGGLAGFGIPSLVGLVFAIVLWCFLLYDLFTLPSQVGKINDQIEDQVIDQLLDNTNQSIESSQQ